VPKMYRIWTMDKRGNSRLVGEKGSLAEAQQFADKLVSPLDGSPFVYIQGWDGSTLLGTWDTLRGPSQWVRRDLRSWIRGLLQSPR